MKSYESSWRQRCSKTTSSACNNSCLGHKEQAYWGLLLCSLPRLKHQLFSEQVEDKQLCPSFLPLGLPLVWVPQELRVPLERMILSSTLDWLSLQHRVELGTWVKAKLLRLHQVQLWLVDRCDGFMYCVCCIN